MTRSFHVIPFPVMAEKADPGQLTFLLLSTRTPAVADFTGPEAGKTAHYMLRWLSTRGLAAAGRRIGGLERNGQRDDRGVRSCQRSAGWSVPRLALGVQIGYYGKLQELSPRSTGLKRRILSVEVRD